MLAWEHLEPELGEGERRLVHGLDTPQRVQGFLDTLAYSREPIYRCPLRTLRDHAAHCFDGAVFAAAVLWRLGHRPLILELLPNERDEGHLLAPFQVAGHWGAVAKSNFVGLRYREPIHRSLRELALSYFEPYYNVAGERTLRGYTAPLNLRAFDARSWLTRDETMEAIAARLDTVRRFRLIDARMEAALAPIDERSRLAGLSGADPSGLYQPPGSS